MRGKSGGTSRFTSGAGRLMPYYMKAIQPHVLDGKTVIVAAHGNSLRALVMALEGLSPEAILKREIATGVPIIYKLNANGTIASRIGLTRIDRWRPKCSGFLAATFDLRQDDSKHTQLAPR